MKKIIYLFLLGSITLSFQVPSFATPQKTSKILKQVKSLMVKKDLEQAQAVLSKSLKKYKNSYRLWLALGYILESQGKYDKALNALYKAKNLKLGIPGLHTRIQRLEDLLKAQKRLAQLQHTDGKALFLLQKARYKIRFKKIVEGLKLFIEAVKLDRKILAEDHSILNKGIKFLVENHQNNEDKRYLLANFYFYAGNYKKAQTTLTSFISDFKNSKHLKEANKLLKEIDQINKLKKDQPLADSQSKHLAPKITEKKKIKQKEEKQSTKSQEEYKPDINDEYANYESDQLYQEGLESVEEKPSRAIKLISKAVKRTSTPSSNMLMTLADLYSLRKSSHKAAVRNYRKIMKLFPGTEEAQAARQKILDLQPSNMQRAREVREALEKRRKSEKSQTK